MAGMLIMNMHITIFIAHLDMDQQRRNRYPAFPFITCVRSCVFVKTEAVFQTARTNPPLCQAPLTSLDTQDFNFSF